MNRLLTLELPEKVYNPSEEQAKQASQSPEALAVQLLTAATRPVNDDPPAIAAFIACLKASPYVDSTHVDISIDEQAWQLFSQRLDKNWSLVDCAIFVIMQHHNILEAFTTDHHFEQAGFVCLLKD
jgi:uncharacterized protein